MARAPSWECFTVQAALPHRAAQAALPHRAAALADAACGPAPGLRGLPSRRSARDCDLGRRSASSRTWHTRLALAAAGAVAAQRARPPIGRRFPVRPGKVSAVRSVPQSIPRPPYLDKGTRIDPRTQLPAHAFMHCIEVKTQEQIDGMRAACALAREALEVAGRCIAPGVTPDYIDSVAHDFIVSRGAYPSPLGYMGFPKSISTSVNDIIAHGIPDDRPLDHGDIVNVDVTVYLGGFHGDTSSMFLAGQPDPEGLELCRAAFEATRAGIAVCGPGVDFREVGKRIEGIARAADCHCSPLFVGHGIGSYFHGAPEVVPCVNDLDQGLMRPGMTFTVEPILVEHDDDSYDQWDDAWTIQTMTNARSAQFEHTILITEDGLEVLTGPSIDFENLGK